MGDPIELYAVIFIKVFSPSPLLPLPPLPRTLGNHESITMNQMYGFEGEVKSKYSATMAELFTELFEWLPLAHCIEGKILVWTLKLVDLKGSLSDNFTW